MKDVLETLFQILPFVLAIIFGLSRIKRRSSAPQKSQSVEDRAPEQRVNLDIEPQVLHEYKTSTKEQLINAEPIPSSPPEISEAAHRLLKDKAYVGMKDSRKSPGVINRINKLPPLAQGLVWSFILDEPLGMKDRNT